MSADGQATIEAIGAPAITVVFDMGSHLAHDSEGNVVLALSQSSQWLSAVGAREVEWESGASSRRVRSFRHSMAPTRLRRIGVPRSTLLPPRIKAPLASAQYTVFFRRRLCAYFGVLA